ncbi:MAG TPA: fused MFS/spermidine synthase [Thermoanaerobaculia bacterium]|nr:fused MFS/spermidine synthase [Thermoanaerobaculia bacterium]
MRSLAARASLLLFGSGFCALVYQTAWLRMLRLVFGASTASSAAVLAIFMAGLGIGSLLLGPRADRRRSPLLFYAHLEAGIAVAAGLSPWLVALVRDLYLGLGGSARLGLAGGTGVRLVLAALVLGLPTFLMGGTLPAVARAVERSADRGRRLVGRLYAANTLGAVAGAVLTTFFSLEVLGTRKAVWVAALINLLVALAARRLALRLDAAEPAAAPEAEPAAGAASAAAPDPFTRRFVPVAAALVGFAFLLMELVWYRMLAPILGGSSYTFGLILAVALLGIGLGGYLYGAQPRRRRPTLLAFAGTCALEALLLAIPFALGDRLAVLAIVLRPLGSAGFLALVFAWTVIALVVVLPAAYVAGYQFPLLIALLGAGRRRVGREVGLTYAANTVGAVAGSIAGGFGLLPLLTAPGVWRLVTVLLVALAAVAVAAHFRAVRLGAKAFAPGSDQSWERRPSRAQRDGLPGPESLRPAALPLAAGALALLACAATGPTAFWRHSAIGAGRVRVEWSDPNGLRRSLHGQRLSVVREWEGVESSVALVRNSQYAFLINGKSDGSARGDAPTQVMGGLVPAMLHPAPRRSLVIGLGTGSTAGWLAAVPTMERVDVVELEPAVLEVARACAAVNRRVLEHPKVRVAIGDGRELLLTTGERYDVVFSEPSNPYRAGVASLFTEDFYRAAVERLAPGGLFAQWLQGYEVDAPVVRTVYATLGAVFPSVESWQVSESDLLLLASREPIRHDFGRVRARAGREPYRSALDWTWGVAGAEGFYTGFLGSAALARSVGEPERRWLNTDDRSVLEFGFARTLGRLGLFRIAQLRTLAESQRAARPRFARGDLDWVRVEDLRVARLAWVGGPLDAPPPGADRAVVLRRQARHAFRSGQPARACASWRRQPQPPASHLDLLLLGECLAGEGNAAAAPVAAELRRHHPIEAELVLARLDSMTGRPAAAGRRLLAAFRGLRTDPWIHLEFGERALQLALPVAQVEPAVGLALYRELARPFAAGLYGLPSLRLRIDLARALRRPELCVEALAPFEPHVPWERDFLAHRADCYRRRDHPLAARAERDLADFLDDDPPQLGDGMVPKTQRRTRMAQTGGPVPPYGEAIQQAVASGDLAKMKAVAREAESFVAQWGNVPAALEELKLEIAKLERTQR